MRLVADTDDNPCEATTNEENSEEDSIGEKKVSWSAFHSNLQQHKEISKASVTQTSLLPLFYDEAHSIAMIRHAMDVIKRATEILNPGQVPIITVDQPLYAIAKQIQWNWKASHGESQFIVMFGGLHIEMAALKALGTLLNGSGWTAALGEAKVASPGTAESFLHASHVTRTRRAHQVTACSLYILLKKAYLAYSSNLEENAPHMSFNDWCSSKSADYPQFKFWSLVLQFEIDILIFVRALREGDFNLYIDALTNIVPWFFALDHIHYARWLPVHIRDMVALRDIHPTAFSEFVNGKFVVKKTTRRFSAISIDQAHEQNNALVKGDGGAVGLTENPAALHRWMVSGPEMARLIQEFEISTDKKKTTDLRHHEDTEHAQTAFKRDVCSLVNTIDHFGNPFCEGSCDLLVLDNRNIAEKAIVESVFQIDKLGQEQYNAYVNERLVNQNLPVSDPIKKNSLPLFGRPQAKEKNKTQQQLTSLKNDRSLFSRLYVASQVRDGNLDEFFEHENQAYPPALSQNGAMRTTKKADLVACLEDLVPFQESTIHPSVQVTIFDGSAIVNMLRPGAAKTFLDYAQQVFLPYIVSQLQHVERIDVIWDQYFSDSLKLETRKKRGKGVRRRVEASTAIPGNWQVSGFFASTTIKQSCLLS